MSTGQLDRMKESFAAAVRAVFPRLAYYGRFPSTVVVQNADGTLELKPDDLNVGAPSKVPIRLGIPGASVKVLPGARVMLGFEAGDPSKPVAELWESASVTELHLTGSLQIVLNGGVLGVARQTDSVVGTAGPYPVVANIAGGSATVRSG